MATEPPAQKPSLFMNAFQEIHERLKIDQTEEDTRNDGFASKNLNAAFQKQIVNYWEFMKALPWTEWWMIVVTVFHICCFILIIATRNHYNTQYIIFFLLLVLVYLSESINEYAAQNYKLYSTENYFDSDGLFISTVFSAPILFNCVLLIAVWLRSATNTMIDIKRKQIATQQKKKDDGDGLLDEKETESKKSK